MKQKKVPMRTCVVTKEKYPKKELIRVVRDNTGKVTVDKSGKQNGRGAYLKKDLEVVDMPLSYNEVTNIFTDSDLLPQINVKYYRNFVKTVQNLQVNEKALKQELIDINNRLSALETAKASESEVNNDISVE